MADAWIVDAVRTPRGKGRPDGGLHEVHPQELLARVGSLARLKRYTDDLDSAAAIITTLATMIEARDGYTEGHCHRMANYATAVGRALLGHKLAKDFAYAAMSARELNHPVCKGCAPEISIKPAAHL